MENFESLDRVEHPLYGRGQINQVFGDGMVEVIFPTEFGAQMLVTMYGGNLKKGWED